jgi:hypothetical protein
MNLAAKKRPLGSLAGQARESRKVETAFVPSGLPAAFPMIPGTGASPQSGEFSCPGSLCPPYVAERSRVPFVASTEGRSGVGLPRMYVYLIQSVSHPNQRHIVTVEDGAWCHRQTLGSRLFAAS